MRGRPDIEPSRLLEREDELRAIRGALAAARRGRGQVVVVQGSAGIGKSSLLERAAELGRREGMQVLAAAGQELEGAYSFGLVLDLFGAVVRDAKGSPLTGSAALAAPIFESPGEGTVGDQLSLLHGLYWLTLGLAEQRPLLLVVDDAHWADEASLRFLAYLAPRLADARACLMVGLRPVEESGVEGAQEAELLASLLVHPSAEHLEPAPLSVDAVGEMLTDFGLSDPHRWLQRSSWTATGGNPFLLRELLRTGNEELIRSLASQHWDGTGVPASIERGITGRLRGASPEARRLAEAVAVLGDEAELEHVAALAHLSPQEALDQARRLVELALFDPRSGLAFIHPVARSVIYAHVPLAARAQAHSRAARLLSAAGAPPERVAPHLLLVEPAGDAATLAVLRRAASAALARGDPRTAARLLERALAEPPPPDQEVTVLVELARAETALGAERAVETYRRALARARDHRERAAIQLGLGHGLIAAARWAEAADAFQRGLEELHEPSDPLVAQLEAGYVAAAWVAMVRRDEIEDRIGRILGAPKLEPAQRELAAWTAFQGSTAVNVTSVEALRLVDRAIEEVPIDELVVSGQTVELAAGVLVGTDQLEREIAFLTDAIEAVQRSGVHAKLGIYAYCRAWPLYYSGRLSEAVADAEEALRAAELGWEAFLPATCTVLSQALLERGDIDAAERVIQLDPERWGQRIDYQLLIPIARGRIHLERGELEAALEAFAAARTSGEATGTQTPGPPSWRPWAAVTLARKGEREAAVALAREALSIAERWGAGWPIGVAQRVLGLAMGGDEGLEMLAQSVRTLSETSAQLELARAGISHGSALRRAGRVAEAREPLTRGMDLAHRLGARLLQDRARDELVASGSRPRRYTITGVQSLTPSELRVARLAAAGRTNREIAQLLFVTPKAVEYHLANAYRKLEISSRRELGAALAEGSSLAS